MIVVDEENSGERSPLKSPNSDPTTQGGPPPPPPPPPPYAPGIQVVAAAQYSSYQPAPPRPPPVTVLVVRRETPQRRFLKAFGIALIIIFLWSAFVDSLDMAIGRNHRHRGNSTPRYEEKGGGLEWIVRDWYKSTPSAAVPPPCTCNHGTVPTTTTTGVVRVLPVDYPPTPRPQVEISIPTASQRSLEEQS
ncbi:hypothetical protein BDN70DRAFT_879141 [Pholiota conissans]|uniref:Uncharacterized protein n=1 Tax=Pholiota conissans TaxID=109636 RepID=A0A9P5Z2S3_9AGAR|nr:hypothetical protein BDN70DRAFT_879141 [Pholiota conissans]